MPLNFSDKSKDVFRLSLGDDFKYPDHMATQEQRDAYYADLIEALDACVDSDDMRAFVDKFTPDLKYIGQFKNNSVKDLIAKKQLEIFERENSFL